MLTRFLRNLGSSCVVGVTVTLVACGSSGGTGGLFAANGGDAGGGGTADASGTKPDGAAPGDDASPGADASEGGGGEGDAGPVTSLTGGFHAGIGGEENVTIDPGGTWKSETWVCVIDGAGGGCSGGTWEATNSGLRLLPPAGKTSFYWIEGGEATSVIVSIVGGKLHTVADTAGTATTMDLLAGYECYVDCDKGIVALCSKPGSQNTC
jgi:hypothetical protein